MALNVGVDASFENMDDLKGIREKEDDLNSTKAYTTEYPKSLEPMGIVIIFLILFTG
jgi:hypothetical protein